MNTVESRRHRISTSQDNEPYSTWRGHENSGKFGDTHAPRDVCILESNFKVSA